ncbi:hypothetical protein M2O49_004336 [Citrobacter amalonaticus]
MSNIDKRAFAITKELATLMVERFSMNPVSSKLLNEAWQKEFPDEVAIAARMLALLDELEAKDQRIAKLSASHGKLREAMAGIHNTIRGGGAYTPLAGILNASRRAYEESAAAAAKGE